MFAPPQGVPVHAVPDPARPRHPTGNPGDPRLTAGIASLVEDLRQRYAVPRSSILAAIGLSPGSWRDWTTGRYRIREARCRQVLDRVKLIQSTIDPGAIRALPPGPRRRDAFLAAASIAIDSPGIG